MQDQKLVNAFLRDFVARLSGKYGDEIDFIILFGSAARGEWKRGISDVDLVVQLKKVGLKQEISEYAEGLFWGLDKKYGTKFEDVCTIKQPEKIGLVEAIKFAERQARLYVPFEVVGPGEMDWEKCEFNDPFFKVGAFLIFPKSLFFLKIKAEGKVLYGRNVLKRLRPKVSIWDVSKILLNPYNLALMSVFTVYLSPNFAVKHAIKGIMYEIESVLIFLERPISGGVMAAFRRLKMFVRGEFIDWAAVEEAFDLKYNWEERIDAMSYREKISFCWKSLIFIVSLSWFVIFLKAASIPRQVLSSFLCRARLCLL